MPESEGRYTEKEALEEAEKMNKSIDIGEAADYQEAAKFAVRDAETAEDNIKIIEDMIVPVEHILEQAKEQVERGEYNLLVADDTRGRIPSLILHQVLKDIYAARGFASPEIAFLASGRFTPEEQTKANELISRLVQRNTAHGQQTRSLIITELIYSGENVSHIVDVLQKQDTPFDVACLYLDVGDYQRSHRDLAGKPAEATHHQLSDWYAGQLLKEMQTKFGTKVLWGGGRRDESWKYMKLSGLEKIPGQATARVRPEPYEGEQDVQDTIRQTRTEVAKVSQQVLRDYQVKYDKPRS